MARSSFCVDALGRAAGLALALATGGCALLAQPDPIPVVGGEQLIQPPDPAAQRAGSLWRPNVSDSYLFTDVRARLPGDLLTVVVYEDDSGSKEAETGTKNDSSVFANLKQLFGLPQALAEKNPDIDPEALIEAESKREFEGAGTTSRKGRLKARVGVEVKAVSVGGNLLVAGDKIVSVNNEDQHVVLSGWVRPQDIDAKNEIDSSKLASARIQYYGQGPLGRQQHQPWGIAILDWVWPF